MELIEIYVNDLNEKLSLLPHLARLLCVINCSIFSHLSFYYFKEENDVNYLSGYHCNIPQRIPILVHVDDDDRDNEMYFHYVFVQLS